MEAAVIIERNSIPEPNSGCWLWVGGLTRDGQPRASMGGTTRIARLVALECRIGPLRGGSAKPACDNVMCVNPDHLERTPSPAEFIGKSFGSWTVVEYIGSNGRSKMVRVRCACGFERALEFKRLSSGVSRRCKRCGTGQNDTLRDRLFSRCVSSSTGCWEWTGPRVGLGYGVLRWEGKNQIASRVALESRLGRKLEPGEFALHRCDNPPCCNPDHLFPGSRADNMDDMVSKGRSTRGTNSPFAKLDDAKVFAILKSTKGDTETALQFGCSREKVSTIRRGEAWTHVSRPANYQEIAAARPGRGSRGEASPSSTITDAIASEVLASPERSPVIAKRLGVSCVVVRQIRRGVTWRHVPRPPGYDALRSARDRFGRIPRSA